MDKKLCSIDVLGLSTRSRNSLYRAGIYTLGDLLTMSESEIVAIKNLGTKSVEEILTKISEYNNQSAATQNASNYLTAENFDTWISEETNCNIVIDYLKEENVNLDALPLLSARSYNLLAFAGYTHIWQIAFKSVSQLMEIAGVEESFADEIYRHIMYFVKENVEKINAYIDSKEKTEAKVEIKPDDLSIYDIIKAPEYRKRVTDYVKANDIQVSCTVLSNRAKKQLISKGYANISDIIFMDKAELGRLKNIGATTLEDTYNLINKYLTKHADRIVAFANGDDSVMVDDEAIRNKILKLYDDIGFKGLSFSEIKEKLALPDFITDERIKKSIGSLIAEKQLTYVDFRCHRIFGKFTDFLESCTTIEERSREVIKRRLHGETLDSIAQVFGITRERVRQIQTKDTKKVEAFYTSITNLKLFDEDYYRYLFETYSFDRKDAEKWFGIPDYIWNYFDIKGVKQGKKEIDCALEDTKNLDAGLRLKIKNYTNRNKLYIDGVWVPKLRAGLEDIVLRKFCKENVSFSEFTALYNKFLRDIEVDPDDSIYYSDKVERTRKNKLADSKLVLWKLNEQIRYYDIDSRDYTELLDTLNLESFENVEISTLKLFKMYPDVMEKYDIRDHYELHNLLRKIVPDGSYDSFHCSRTPDIKFGTFDRDKAIFELMSANAPIATQELADLINEEYGYDQGVVMSTYLQPLSKYYHQGIYSVDQKKMSKDNLERLRNTLTKDFYYIKEIEKIYSEISDNADLEEINPYNLKVLGFQVFSKYALKNHSSLELYFEKLLTENDITDLATLKKRYTYVQAFYGKLMELKRDLQIIEFCPNQLIHIRKLERSGISKKMLYEFCDAVYNFVNDDKCFSIKSIRQDGFGHELFECGLEDWFFSNVLLSDDRLSSATIYNNKIFCKSKREITTKAFEYELVKEHGSVDIYDLLNELTDRFGCTNTDRYDVVFKLGGTGVYHDKILDRLYINSDLYYRELDEAGGM